MFKKRPHILITNDDGIRAKGIRHLWNSLKDYADITVVGPSNEQSAVSLSITLRNPLVIERVDWGVTDDIWSVSGTPADCVKLALHAILKRRPDFVVSGINRGANSGRNVLYSGTVAAAIESVMQGIPAIAFSVRDYVDPDFSRAEKYVPLILKHVIDHPLPSGTLLNVNFPEKDFGEYKGFKMAQQGLEYWSEDPSCRSHPAEGNSYYWLGSQVKQVEEREDSDITWLRRGFITAVPIHIKDLTDQNHLDTAKSHFESCFIKEL
ncbi:MAG: 5'/3'-nucleotidase SurE [Parachlamydiaceae bacterium]|nr:5'/3'-nucleotidase SurE [Parachlamydiaceae bacterium]